MVNAQPTVQIYLFLSSLELYQAFQTMHQPVILPYVLLSLKHHLQSFK